jgi:hypothetical protein
LAEIPSAPTKSFAYGAPIREMRPSSPQGPPPPLQAQETYRVVIEAGEAKGHADFKVD